MGISAKEYLSQVNKLTEGIHQRQEQLREIESNLYGSKGISYDKLSVQTSISGNLTEDGIIRMIDLQKEIEDKIIEMMQKKHQIIEEIQSLSEEKHIKLLYRRYMTGETNMQQVAKDMGYEYKWCCKLHGYALKEFETTVLRTRTNTN